MEPKLDSVAWPVVEAILLEVPKTFASRGLEVPSVVPQFGEAAVLDVTEDGCVANQAWVRLVGQVPSKSFPIGDVTPWFGGPETTNAPVEFATTIEVGVVHCTEWPDDPLFTPTAQQYVDDARRAYAEQTGLRLAIVRALAASKRRYLISSFSPLNDGLASGGSWTVQFDWMRGGRG